MNDVTLNTRIIQYAKINKMSEDEAKKQLEQQGEIYEEGNQSDLQNAVDDRDASLAALEKQAMMKMQGTVISETAKSQGQEKEYKLNGVTLTVSRLDKDAAFSYKLSGDTLTITASKNCIINVNELKNKNLNIVIDNKSSYLTLNSNVKVNSITNNANNSIINGSAQDDNIVNKGKNVIIHAGNGADSIRNDGVNTVIFAGLGDDTVVNTGLNAVISGGAGNDSLSSTGDKAVIDGDTGNDTVSSRGNNTTISGGDGVDKITNRGSGVKISGGADTDVIYNYGEKTEINGDAGNDKVINNANTATISGGDGNDNISSVGEEVVIDGGSDVDTISSEGDNATISGGADNDRITTQGNNVLFSGDTGIDLIDGRVYVEGEIYTGVLSLNGKYYEEGLLKTGIVLDEATNTMYKYLKGDLQYTIQDQNESNNEIDIDTVNNKINFTVGPEELYPGDNVVITKDGYVMITNANDELCVFYPTGIIAYENGILYGTDAKELSGYYTVSDTYTITKADADTGLMYTRGRIADGRYSVTESAGIYTLKRDDENGAFFQQGKLLADGKYIITMEDGSYVITPDDENGQLYYQGSILQEGKYTVTNNDGIYTIISDESGEMYVDGKLFTGQSSLNNKFYYNGQELNGRYTVELNRTKRSVSMTIVPDEINGKFYIDGELVNNQYLYIDVPKEENDFLTASADVVGSFAWTCSIVGKDLNPDDYHVLNGPDSTITLFPKNSGGDVYFINNSGTTCNILVSHDIDFWNTPVNSGFYEQYQYTESDVIHYEYDDRVPDDDLSEPEILPEALDTSFGALGYLNSLNPALNFGTDGREIITQTDSDNRIISVQRKISGEDDYDAVYDTYDISYDGGNVTITHSSANTMYSNYPITISATYNENKEKISTTFSSDNLNGYNVNIVSDFENGVQTTETATLLNGLNKEVITYSYNSDGSSEKSDKTYLKQMIVEGEVANNQFVTYTDENGNEVRQLFVGGTVIEDGLHVVTENSDGTYSVETNVVTGALYKDGVDTGIRLTVTDKDGNPAKFYADVYSNTLFIANTTNCTVTVNSVPDDDWEVVLYSWSTTFNTDVHLAKIENDGRNNVINGTDGDDVIHSIGGENVTINAGAGNDTIYTSGVEGFVVNAGDGDDSIRLNYSKNITINGGAGNDTINNVETNRNYGGVVLDGGDGDDIINTKGENNAEVIANAGNDTVTTDGHEVRYVDGRRVE